MTFEDILDLLDDNTKIKVVINMYGMNFSAIHCKWYMLDNEKLNEIRCAPVKCMTVVDGELEVTLGSN